MSSEGARGAAKLHVVCVPYPAQGHITPMLMTAKLLHSKGFHITFVNTVFNHHRLLRSRGAAALDGLPDFRFVSIPDGLPPSDEDATQDIPALCASIKTDFLSPFLGLMGELAADGAAPPVSCIVSDGVMVAFTLDAGEALGIPVVVFWTTSACGFLGYRNYHKLADEGFFPLKSEDELTNGYLDTPIEWAKGMKNMRLQDFPSFIRSTDRDDVMFNFCDEAARRASSAAAVFLNTFEDLEGYELDALREDLGVPVLAIGPLCSKVQSSVDPRSPAASLGSNLWREETGFEGWLQGKPPASVVYVNFGSITVMTKEQLAEFAWGLAGSGRDFVWVIRQDLVKGEAAVLPPPEFMEETKGRGVMLGWCPQEAVLRHPAVGGFLTHCGWNSTLESIVAGVPMICWPFFAEQQTNCRYCCEEWGVGMEIGGEVRREEVEGMVREMMEGEGKGKEMRRRAAELKELAAAAVAAGGKFSAGFERLLDDVLLSLSRSRSRRRREEN